MPDRELQDFASHRLKALKISDTSKAAKNVQRGPTTTYVDSLLFVDKVQWRLPSPYYNQFLSALKRFSTQSATVDETAEEIRRILQEANEPKLLDKFMERFLPDMKDLLKSEEDVLKVLSWTNLDQGVWEGTGKGN